MYIKKSIMSGTVMGMGVVLLTILTVLFCFTETQIPKYVYITLWVICVVCVIELVKRIERKHTDKVPVLKEKKFESYTI